MIKKIAWATSETRSFKRAGIVLKEVGGLDVSANTAQRASQEMGLEMAVQRDDPDGENPLSPVPANVPTQAVVECDGGRIRTRLPGRQGVEIEGNGWRETKNAVLIRATHQEHEFDPQPEPPECFLDAEHVAKIAECAVLEWDDPEPEPEKDAAEKTEDKEEEPPDHRPRRLVRTVVSSMANSKVFGPQMEYEARRRRFFEARAQVFLGDGLPWNWSIQQAHFPTFTPVLDFIHVLSYLHVTARAVQEFPGAAWEQYESWLRQCWSGKVGEVLEEMRRFQERLEDEEVLETLRVTIGYLENNKSRMDYPRYRRSGHPVTTAWMESLVKEINYRVKGTEMFWDAPDGAEAILQLRAAALCDDNRLNNYLDNRPGYPYVRKNKLTVQSLQ